MSSTSPRRARAWTQALFQSLAALSLALVLSPAAQAQALWDKATAGMSAADVVKAVPGARKSSGAEAGESGCGASLDNARLGGIAFNVCFVFIPDALGRVLMRQPDEYAANAVTQKAYVAVAAELSRRYGKEEVVKRLETGGSGLMGKSSWHQGKTRVDLTATPLTATTSGLVVFITTE